jgi:5-methylcytosine-specific restriction endonuclease McrA
MQGELRQLVRRRAGLRCEYCRIREEDLPFSAFHLDHIIARQHGGATSAENLAWSCHECNLHKGPNLSSVDPETRSIVPLFNPRIDTWNDHFQFVEFRIDGRSPVGRATVWALELNSPERLELRFSLGHSKE